MKLKELTAYLESFAPLELQEPYDNSGLLVGDPNQEILQALISLDCTEDVVDEAIRTGCDVIISHHPIIFKGLRRLTGSTSVERVVMKAIRHGIALYAIHTNLDNVIGGVNARIADRLGLQKRAVLSPKAGLLEKMIAFVPRSHVESVRQALFDAGAGKIGDYDQCSFNAAGYSTFRGLEGSDPFVGEVGEQHREEETRMEIIYPQYLHRKIQIALLESHPYEEPAFDRIAVKNDCFEAGAGMIGMLEKPMDELEFMAHLKHALRVSVIRHTEFLNKPIERVAVCGGSGGFLLKDAVRSGADVFITADFKYHEFFDADGQVLIADVGHFESEQFTSELLLEIIQKKFTTFAVRLTGINTNPINYYS